MVLYKLHQGSTFFPISGKYQSKFSFGTLDKHFLLKDLLENLEFNEECPTPKYYTPSEFSHLSLDKLNIYIHLNISSLSNYIDELNLLLSELVHKPKIIAISESRIRKNKEPLSVIDIPGYDYEFTATEGEKGGTLIYISQDLTYKNRSDLNISQVKQLESTFIEVVNENRKNTIVGCIYKHPNMPITEFFSDFLELLLTKISLEKKEVILLGDYNINLSNCESDKNTSEFLGLMLYFSLMPRIMNPTRITPRSHILIDNIFYSEVQPKIIACNIATDISDHLTHVIAIPGRHTEHLNEDIYRRNYKALNHHKFKEDFNKIDWVT